jgi:hypothetical protein
MFPHQQMAMGLMPRDYVYVTVVGCHICTATCCDTGGSCWLSCGASGTYPCDLNASRIYNQAQVQAGDPVEELQALRRRLEVALAGAEAQEQALRRQREGGADQKR